MLKRQEGKTRYKKILVALDGSHLSEGILPCARFFAKTLKVPVELLQVIDPETVLPSIVEQDRYHDIVVDEREKNGDYLKKIAISFSDALSVDCSVEVGKPADVIVDRAAADIGTLIAMATHGHSGVKRWLLGSVADKVLRTASNHLLLIRTTKETKSIGAVSLKSVLVPLDGSGLPESVIPHVVELAKKSNIEIVLVRVFRLQNYYADGYWPEKVWEAFRDDAKDYLEEKVNHLKREGVVGVTSVLLEGYPARRIIDLAQKTPQSLVAMCMYGKYGVGRRVVGSVTDRVVRHSGDPVLVIRPLTESR